MQLGFTPIRPLQQADLDGDGEPELLALEFGPAFRHNTLHAFSIMTGRELWAEIVGEVYYDRSRWYVAANPDLPMTADLDDDGRPEIVAAGSGAIPPLGNYRGVKLLDGLTGKLRWQRPMSPDSSASDGLIQAIIAPDLNGDGTRDLVTISLFAGKNPAKAGQPPPDEPARAYVDAISGKDGSRSGSGTSSCRRESSLGSGRCTGGAAATTVGPCSPCRSAGHSRTAWKGASGVHCSTPRSSICSRLQPGANARP